MVAEGTALAAIAGMALVTYATRVGGFLLMGLVPLTARVEAFLRNLSSSVWWAVRYRQRSRATRPGGCGRVSRRHARDRALSRSRGSRLRLLRPRWKASGARGEVAGDGPSLSQPDLFAKRQSLMASRRLRTG